MTTVYLAPTFGAGYQAFTTGGLPLNAGLIYTYIAGGTTPQATCTTSAGTVQNANPIVLGADGRTPAEVWFATGVAYRIDVKDSLGNLIQTYDNLYGIGDPNASNAAAGIYPLTSVAGTANAITAVAPASLSAFAANQVFTMIPAATNTGATAIVITPTGGVALASKNIFASGVACSGGELVVGVPVELFYDGTQLNIIGLAQRTGTWTPVLTFVTPGNLNVVYSTQVGSYTKVGRLVTVTGRITTSTFTFTTASGQLQITGLPYASRTQAGELWIGALAWQGITNASHTNVVVSLASAAQLLTLTASGSATGLAGLNAADTPTGGTVDLQFTISYEAAS